MKLQTSSIKLLEANNQEVIFEFQEPFWTRKKIFRSILWIVAAAALWYLTDVYILVIIITGVYPILKKEHNEYVRNLRVTQSDIIFNRITDFQYDDRQILAGQVNFDIQAFSNRIELTLFEHKINFENSADFTLFLDHFVKIADLKYDKTIPLNNGKEQLIYRK